MCEANVYISYPEKEHEELVLESVDEIVPEGPNSWRLKNIFGEQKILEGRIDSMNLVNHRIVFICDSQEQT